jgi:competence protein ComEA
MSFSHRNNLLAAVASCAMWLMAVPSLAGADKPKLPDGPGKETTQRICGTCHAAELVMNRRETFEGWNGVLEDMVRRGMKGTDEELGEVVDYLVAHFPKTAAGGKVNVNKATAKELASGLGIPDDQAAAIVQHRDAKGAFKSLEEIAKVQGVDARAIEAKKDKIEF